MRVGALVLALLAATGCGSDDPDSAAVTTVSPEEPSECLAIEAASDYIAWWRSYCRVYEAPGRIVALELVPAVTGDNAEPPNGQGWDWPAVAQACDHLLASLPPIAGVLDEAPDGVDEVVAKAEEYVDLVATFATSCEPAAVDEDYAAMKELTPLLEEAAAVSNELFALATLALLAAPS